MTGTIHELLREAINERYGGNLTRLAEALDVPVQSVSKWVAENERKRTIPGPASCRKIARGLGLDADYVLQLAGHREAEDEADDNDPVDQDVRMRMQRYASIVASYPRALQVAVIEANIRMAEAFRSLASAPDNLAALSKTGDAHGTIKTPSQAPISSPDEHPNQGSNRSNDGLTAHKRWATALVGSS